MGYWGGKAALRGAIARGDHEYFSVHGSILLAMSEIPL